MQTLIVINPKAGHHETHLLERDIQGLLQSAFAKEAGETVVWVSTSAQDLRHLVAQHHETLTRVVAAGGDGTVMETIAAIREYPHIELGILPVGTGNRLADNLGIPTQLKGALDAALRGDAYRLDLGEINGQFFALMAGAGFDADIMDNVLPVEKRYLGIFAYLFQGFKRAFQAPYAIWEVRVDGQLVRTRGIGVVVANAGNLLGRYFTLTPGARTNDGLLDVCILATRNRSDYLGALIQILLQHTSGFAHPGIQHLRGQHIQVRSRPRLKVQADGDVIGQTPFDIVAHPQAMTVRVPRAQKATSTWLKTIQNTQHALFDALFGK